MNTKTIAALLHMTPEKVEDLHLSIYLEWVGRMAKELGYCEQSLAANTSVSKWFSYELERLEYEAYEALQPGYGLMSAIKARTIYNAIISDIHKAYSKTLFDQAQKLQIINEPHDYRAN